MELKDQVVVVTGASSGIGAEAARQFAALGAHVVLTSEREDDLNQTVDALRAAGYTATPILVDFSHPDQVEGLIARIEEAAGPIAVLVNNAGVGLGASVLETREKDLRFLFDVNVFALISLCRQVLERMAARKSGRIINVSSAAGRFGSPGVSAYSATKGAVHAYSQALRAEAFELGVYVSEVLPISVRTRFFENVKGEKYKPGGVVLTVEQVAAAIVRCARSDRPPAEVLPYVLVKLAFVLDAIYPGLLARITARNYQKRVKKTE